MKAAEWAIFAKTSMHAFGIPAVLSHREPAVVDNATCVARALLSVRGLGSSDGGQQRCEAQVILQVVQSISGVDAGMPEWGRLDGTNYTHYKDRINLPGKP